MKASGLANLACFAALMAAVSGLPSALERRQYICPHTQGDEAECGFMMGECYQGVCHHISGHQRIVID